MSSAPPTRLPDMFDPRRDATLSLSAIRRIDRQCEQFDQAIQTEEPISIETCLEGFSGQQRVTLLRELLALELEYCFRRGESPTCDEYSQRFPEQLPILDLVFAEVRASAAGEVA